MKFIVGGSQGIYIVNNGKKDKIRSGHIYGVTFDKNNIYCCERIATGTNIIQIDKNTHKVKYCHRVPGGGVHQAYYDTVTGHLFVTITKTDQLL